MKRCLRPIVLILFLLSAVASARMNSPYQPGASDEKIYYGSFTERPKHLDPAVAYSADEYRFICLIYEPVVQYHYLKRPYQLCPLTAREMPDFQYFDADGNPLPDDASSSKVARTVWTIHLQKGIMYQEHPCFARDEEGAYLYRNLSAENMDGVRSLFDFPHTDTRELKARDYVYQIKRLADPRLNCPIFSSVVGEYIVGMREYAQQLQARIQQIREKRKEKAGIFYNREEDEEKNPIVLDYDSLPADGLEVVDDYTFKITLNRKYPQFRYWLAMPFFSPMPEEAIRFYRQKETIQRNITLDRNPVGTGPFRISKFKPSWRIVLKKNKHYDHDQYPTTGEKGDREKGLLEDAGKTLPLIDKAVYSMERESSARWWKFMQGYYDISGISSENFTRVMNLSGPQSTLSEHMKERGIRLRTSVQTTVFYIGFNMRDPVVGGRTARKRKLRQALSIAIDREEYIQIFMNGRGIVAHSPIPPGIFGHRTGKEGMNPHTHKWDPERGRAVRRSVEYARKLLAQAGYPEGIGPEGNRLKLEYTTVHRPGRAVYLQWLKKQFSKLNVKLVIRETDYNRFREKVSTGNYQILSWGWNADYPDPENLLFLLYGPNGRVEYNGENTVNYANPEYDKLFEKMKTMPDGPERRRIIYRMVDILQRDAPWEFGFHPQSYSLYHEWVRNVKPNNMANNTLKYYNIDGDRRAEYRTEYNQPRWWIVLTVIGVLIVAITPGVVRAIRREMS